MKCKITASSHNLLLPILATLLSSCLSNAQAPEAKELLKSSIKYHDPTNSWSTATHHIDLRETRPNGQDRFTKLLLDVRQEHFQMERTSEGHEVVQTLNKNKTTHLLDGSSITDTALISKHRLTDERLHMMKNYYTYLYGLPMKLTDPGTIIAEEVVEEDFNEIPCWKMKVTYDPGVGDDIWYFYFTKAAARLVGYRFYHDEAANDGEYIILENEANVGKMILPQKRSWYMHKDYRYLGADIIIDN